jgi:NAD-dependent deacetylase
MESSILAVTEFLSLARRVVCLTGAGVSSESGVPTFRDAQTGLWAHYDPDRLASPDGFAADPGLVWRWYMSRLTGVESAEPNAGHGALAALEQRLGDSFVLYTQNVDDLHERAGAKRVHHMHGSITRFRCHRCAHPHTLRPEDREAEEPPRCDSCGGLIRPDVVWFGEALPPGMLERAWEDARSCQLMLVVGTSGLVQPAAQMPRVAHSAGATVVDINPEPGPISRLAHLYVRGRSGEILPPIVEAVKQRSIEDGSGA